jgi:arylsulfatase
MRETLSYFDRSRGPNGEVWHESTGISQADFVATLMGRCSKPGIKRNTTIYWEYPAHGHQQAVRAGEWKAVGHNVNREGSEFELYNQTNDIGERHNVAAEHPEIVRRMNKVAHAAH